MECTAFAFTLGAVGRLYCAGRRPGGAQWGPHAPKTAQCRCTRTDAHMAPARLVDEAVQYLRTAHGLQSLPAPLGSAYAHWGSDPRTAGWHYWRFGARSWEVKARVPQPDPAHAIHLWGGMVDLASVGGGSPGGRWCRGRSARLTIEVVAVRRPAEPPLPPPGRRPPLGPRQGSGDRRGQGRVRIS